MSKVLIVGILCTITAIVSTVVSHSPNSISAIWISNAILVGAMLRGGMRQWRLLIAVGFVANVVANLVVATPVAMSLAQAAINMIEVLIACAAMRLAHLDPRKPVDTRVFFLGVGTAVIAAPVFSAAMAALLFGWANDAPFFVAFADWWVGHALGMLTVLAVVWTFSGSELRDLSRGKRAAEFCSWLVLMPVYCYLAIDTLARPFVVIGLPLLVIAYRSSLFGTSLLNLWTIAAIMAIAQLERFGWLPRIGSSPMFELGFAERGLYCLITIIGPLLISVVMSQRAAATLQLKLVSDQLRFVTDNMPAMIAYKDRELRYRFVNNKFSEWYGIHADDILGRNARQVFGHMFDADFLDALDARMGMVMAGATQRTETRMGDGRDLEVQYEPHVEDGEVVGAFVMAQDVTWRKQSERRFQQLLESAPDAMVIVDAAGTIILANAQADRVFGYPRDRLLGQPVAMLFQQERRHDGIPLGDRFRAGPQVDSSKAFELKGRFSDGRAFPIDLSLNPIQTGDEWVMVAAMRDISERKAAEQALHESKERIEVTLNSIGDAVVTCDPDLRVTLLNPIAEDMTGWSNAEALGKPFDEVVRMIDLESGLAPLSPLRIAMEEDRIVALQTNTVIERRDGLRSPIEDSAAPIHDRDGRVVGGVMVFHDVSESRAMALKMSHLAQHDYLTDLPNRVLLQDRLAQALTSVGQAGHGALLFIDLDHFKTINDSLGHQAGDRVLQEVAHRLSACVRADDTVSRQGGDEFVVLLARLRDPNDAARIAEKMIEFMEAPMEIEGQKLYVGMSIGIALYPQDGDDPRTLMKRADTALYHAKQAGRRRYSYFAASMSERAEQRMRLEHDLRDALRTDQLFLVYQPKVRQPGGQISGMEALVRWRRPDGTVAMPDEFISVAEECGLIVQIDRWVMREACRQNRAWQKAGAQQLTVSVNVSLVRLDADGLLALVTEVLKETGLPPHCLEIEFTESQMFNDEERGWQLIEGLRELHVRVAIDDFGTGYSNLGYLAQYQFDTIKIDRSFIRDICQDTKQDAVVQAIIAMARALNARVVAEGVETRDQARRLEIHGCHELQGYLYSYPVDAAQFGELLRRRIIEAPHASQIEG